MHRDEHVGFRFCGRETGNSTGPYAGLNVGLHVGDDPQAVQSNRQSLFKHLPSHITDIVWMNQTHSSRVECVQQPPREDLANVDGIVTTNSSLALAVQTADCVPLLLADSGAGVIAAVHAGRVGACDGIALNALEVMIAQGANVHTISAWMGPSACGLRYEVPSQMASDVELALPGSRTQTIAGTDGVDIRRGLDTQLRSRGVQRVNISDICTVDDTRFFSYRREKITGRNCSLIWLNSGK